VPTAEPPPVADDIAVLPVRRRGHGRKKKPADLPRQREEIDLTDAEKRCPCCAAPRVRIGADVSERLDYQPASLFVREIARATYVCRNCETNGNDPQIAKPALPPEPLPRSGVGAGLLAHVIVSKIVDHLPLHRQESILARHGWDVRRSTLCDYLRRCAALFTPLYRLMVERVKQSHVVHADDTPLTLLRPRRTAYAWVYLGDVANPYTVFDLTAGRSQEFPTAFFKGFAGFLQADAYAGFNPIHGSGARHVGCWMHARRGFVEAQDGEPKSLEALAFIRTLYAVEREIKDQGLTGEGVVSLRRTRAGPILDQFSDWLEEQNRVALPKSLFGQALAYARNQWPTLVRYLGDARFAIDNGPAEQAIRPLATGRVNWLHIGGDAGLSTASVLLSLCASVKRHGLNPWAYLTDALNHLAARASTADMSDLLPDVWGDRQFRRD
jgi:transposase